MSGTKTNNMVRLKQFKQDYSRLVVGHKDKYDLRNAALDLAYDHYRGIRWLCVDFVMDRYNA